jgi:hypothetical protein
VYSIGVSNKEPAKADVLQGTLDIMILQTLARGASHGYAIAARLEQVSGSRVQLNMGTLYPGLKRLEQRGFISGTWGVTDNSAGLASTRLPRPATGSSPSRSRNGTGR